MDTDTSLILSRLMLALLAGGIIGLERTIHGREAGFRTHTLVCVSASLLMLLMAFQWKLIPAEYIDTIRTDPTRMAQGIMTGIGFLGAGVIIKEGLNLRYQPSSMRYLQLGSYAVINMQMKTLYEG